MNMGREVYFAVKSNHLDSKRISYQTNDTKYEQGAGDSLAIGKNVIISLVQQVPDQDEGRGGNNENWELHGLKHTSTPSILEKEMS